MASVSWTAQINVSKGKHYLGVRYILHDDFNRRADPTKKHQNTNIDYKKTKLNQNFLGITSKEAIARWESRVKEFEPVSIQRNNRVDLACLEMPAPKGLSVKQQQELFQDFFDICCKRFGKENIVFANSHFDEIHQYDDSNTGMNKISRPHIHVKIVPVVNGQLNHKAFCSRENIISLNNEMEDLCQRKYHVPFNTKEKVPKKRVDQMKKESAYIKDLHNTLQAIPVGEQTMLDLVKNNRKNGKKIKECLEQAFGNEQEVSQLHTDLNLEKKKNSQLENEKRKLESENQSLKKQLQEIKEQQEFFERGMQVQQNSDELQKDWESFRQNLIQIGKESLQLEHEKIK
ncbi:Plasmid recombination enzyme [Lachnospiraceae bacterium KHCPX20]|nr:Plasmid recombination enzyme [Lachnospiraceae bacterium KHCPX20]